MSEKQRPHLVWTAAVVGALVALFAVAWWLWSRPSGAADGLDGAAGESTTADAGDPSEDPEVTAARAAEELRAALAAVDEASDQGRFADAAEALDATEKRFPWSDEIKAAATRLLLRETSFRETLFPVEFRIQSIELNEEVGEIDEVFARYSIEGVPVFASEPLRLDRVSPGQSQGDSRGSSAETGSDSETFRELGVSAASGPLPRSHVAVFRTSFAQGASLELVEPASLFDDEDIVFGPVPLSPLPLTDGGTLEFTDPDARVRSVKVRYRRSPYAPGVHVDDPAARPPAGATAPRLLDAITAALARDDLKNASKLLEKLTAESPTEPMLDFVEKRIEARSESLAQNRTSATFTILELAVDPRVTGDDETALWAKSGEAPAFRTSIRTTDDVVLADTKSARTAPYLVPGSLEPPPSGNVLNVTARGSAPLTLVVKDVSPTFSARVVGAVNLPVTLSELPRGSGYIVIEREPRVLIQPGKEANRIRRVVLRWTVAR